MMGVPVDSARLAVKKARGFLCAMRAVCPELGELGHDERST